MATELDEIRQLRAAVWMVGNMDTEHDRAAWWCTFGGLWAQVAREHGEQAQQDADAMWPQPQLTVKCEKSP
jgi:hypothetical protein